MVSDSRRAGVAGGQMAGAGVWRMLVSLVKTITWNNS